MSEFTEIKRKQEISLPKEDENVTLRNEDEDVEAPEPVLKKPKLDKTVTFGKLHLDGNQIKLDGVGAVDCESEDCAKDVLASVKIHDMEKHSTVSYKPEIGKMNYGDKRKALDRFKSMLKKSPGYNSSNKTVDLGGKFRIIEQGRKRLPHPAKVAKTTTNDIDYLRKELQELKQKLADQKASDQIFTNVETEMPIVTNVPATTPREAPGLSKEEYEFTKRYLGLA